MKYAVSLMGISLGHASTHLEIVVMTSDRSKLPSCSHILYFTLTVKHPFNVSWRVKAKRKLVRDGECILYATQCCHTYFSQSTLQKTNPVYTVFMPHLEAHMCPISALAFSCHWMHDVKNLTSELKIDWSLNKTWRQGSYSIYYLI